MPIADMDPSDAKLIAQARAAAAAQAAETARENARAAAAVPGNITPLVTMGANTSGLFVGPIPTGTTRTATGYTTPEPTSSFPAAGTFLGWDYVGQTSTTGTLRRQILADGKGGQKISMATEKNPDYVSGSRGGGSGGSGSGTGTGTGLSQSDIDAALAKANAEWQAKYDALANQQKQQQRANVTTALADFTASLTSAGMGGLVDTINNWILQDKTAAQIAIDIRKEQVYKDRFPGMEALAKAGKAVSEGTYISMERGMIGILKAYGLDDKVLGTTQKLGEVIGGLVNVQEYENRVQLAADHVKKNADVLASLKEYYGVDTAGAMSYLLDPKVGMDVVNKQVRAAEIGAASDLYNFNLNQGEAESFINVAGTADLNALKTEFGKARLLANTQARLSGIEGYDYKDIEAVTTVLGNDQMKMLESQKRAAREVARYSGGSGIGQGSLKMESSI